MYKWLLGYGIIVTIVIIIIVWYGLANRVLLM
jgi:hypothetical protein